MLSDEGEGWPQGAPTSFAGRVVDDAPDVVGGRFLRLEFDEPVDVPGRGRISGAWIKPHFAGELIGDARPISVYTWLVPQSGGWDEPPQSLPDVWALCEVTA